MCNQRSVKEKLLWGILGGFFDTAHACCDYYEKLCSCDDCVLSDVASVIWLPPWQMKPLHYLMKMFILIPYSELNMDQIAQLNEELVKFWLSGRTSVGSTSLSSGVTIKLIREVAENAHTFSSAEDIEKRLPIFSQSHAISMWNIVKQFLQKVWKTKS